MRTGNVNHSLLLIIKSLAKVRNGTSRRPGLEATILQLTNSRCSAGSTKGGLAEEAARHKADLEALQSQDPEFYAYLQQTDRELLDFDAGSSDSEAELEAAGEDEDSQAHVGQASMRCRLGQKTSQQPC